MYNYRKLRKGMKVLWCPCSYNLPCDYTELGTIVEIRKDGAIAKSDIDGCELYINDNTVDEFILNYKE